MNGVPGVTYYVIVSTVQWKEYKISNKKQLYNSRLLLQVLFEIFVILYPELFLVLFKESTAKRAKQEYKIRINRIINFSPTYH